MTVIMRIAAVKDVLKEFLCIIVRCDLFKRVAAAILSSSFPDLFTRDPCRRIRQTVYTLMKDLHRLINTLNAGKGVVFYIRLLIRRKPVSLLPDLVIYPCADSLLMLDVQILCPFIEGPLRQYQRITQHHTVRESYENRIMRFCVQLMLRRSPFFHKEFTQEDPVITQIMHEDDRVIAAHVHNNAIDARHDL